MKICYEITRFTEHMQSKLDLNKHKECAVMNPDNKGRGWHHCDEEWLFERLKQEVTELEEAFNSPDTAKLSYIENIVKECADVANFAMMIADNFTTLK